MTIGVKLDKKWTGPDHGEHGVCAYNGSLGQSPQRDPGAEPLVRGSAENFLRIRHPRKGQTGGLIVMNVIWSHFLSGTPQALMWQKVGAQKPESLGL